MTGNHPVHLLDETVHQRVRLAILATLRSVRSVQFSALKKTLALTDGNLASHLSALERAGLVNLNKDLHEDGVRTSAAITPAGRQALDKELRALEQIIATARKR